MRTKNRKKKSKARVIRETFVDNVGVPIFNLYLNNITFRYGAIIHRLRQRGWKIVTREVNRVEGIYSYTLTETPGEVIALGRERAVR